MALKDILRVGLVQIRVLDLEETLVHYRDRVGLTYVGEIDEERVMLKGYDEFDHHSVVLRKADRAGIDYICFKADSEETLDRILKETEDQFGFPVEVNEPNTIQPGFGRLALFEVPTGHKIGVYATVDPAKQRPMILNPHIWEAEPVGMAPTHFDHALLYGPNQAQVVNWLTDVLGLSITEVIWNEDKSAHVCTWLTAGTRGHDLAILNFPEEGRLHHISFHLEDWNAIGHAADIMGRYGIRIDAGPMRHGITRGQTIYFFDPSGNRNETFAGGYEYFPDHPIREWDAEHTGEGIFYYEKVLNDRFLSVYS